MVTKTFKAESTLETLQLVQTELGADAIVVSMREVPVGPVWNPWKKSAVEIVAARPETASEPPAVLRSAQNGAGVEFVEEVPEIEWDLPAQKPAPLKLNLNPLPRVSAAESAPQPVPARETESAAPSNDRYLPPSLKKVQQTLTQQGVEHSLIENLLNVALETLSPTTLGDAEACKRSIIQLMGAELRVQKGAGAFVSSSIVCVTGASGSGKTSAAAKLAQFYRQTLNKTVTWVCADTVRMGAIAEAKACTDALGLALKLVYTPQDIQEIVSAPQPNDLFLVDTPGCNPYHESQMVELGALLSEMPGRCTYLAVPATTKEDDLVQLSASLGMFNLDGLIVTRLDETRTFGGLYNFARRNQTPLGYFTTGRDPSRHLETADPVRLVEAMFGRLWTR